ncbi:segregation and condensation protein B [Micromonospora rhizosphaerae]|uniref:Segregation and condensation protein B n=2 Tax=Micromonospora rhizosphaerae TaxID=568872 RepID=A0A1C6S835_9ACTN|nr:SMC-Scp complex subunit ScpB [Micromonospora rhizosphaerae]SCL25632.1 segregation and condensation protein B [Micromonospora rhizosphaerae]
MSNEERRDSLADQAAAWVPPWERPAPAGEPADPSDLGAERSLEGADPAEIPAASAFDAAPAAMRPVEVSGAIPEQPAESPVSAPAQMESVAPAPVPGERTEPAAAPAASAEPAGPPGDSAEPAAGPGEGAEPAAGPGDGAEPAAGPGDGAESAATPGESLADAAPAGEGAAAGVPSRQPAGRRRATPAPEPAPELDDAELRGALEAILLVVDEPVSELTLAQVLEQPAERIGPMLDEIAAGYTAAGHGFELRRAAGGWRLYTRPEYASYVERFVLDGQSVRLTQAALETLAVVAYKQPVTRSRISAIRGVNCDGVIRTLVSRGLVEECGTEPDSGAFLYRTTTMFLEKLGLNSVDDLPPLAPFLPDDVEDLADATR